MTACCSPAPHQAGVSVYPHAGIRLRSQSLDPPNVILINPISLPPPNVLFPEIKCRTRLASDVGSGKRDFSGLWDCLSKTAKGPKGVMGLYNGFGVSVMGIIP